MTVTPVSSELDYPVATPSAATFFGWSIGFLASVAFGALLYFSKLAGVGYYIASLSQTLTEELRSSNNPQVALVNPLLKEIPDTAARQVAQLAGIHMLVKEGNMKKALVITDRQALGSQREVKVLKSLLSECKSKKSEKLAAEQTLQSAIKHQSLQQNRWHLLQRDFASLLELPSSPQAREEDSEQNSQSLTSNRSAESYQDGIFAGLPVTENLPDNVSDLQVVYDLVGQERQDLLVKKFAANNIEFQNQLTAIRERTMELVQEQQTVVSTVMLASTANVDANKDYTALKRQALKQTIELIISATRPTVSPAVELAYSELHKQAQKLGYQLPQLNTT